MPKSAKKSFDNKLNILIAYPYFSDPMIDMLQKTFDPDEYRLIVDSGAFTAYNAGHEVKLDDYCNFLTKLQDRGIKMEAYVQLDVIFNEEETVKNLQIMRERGFDPAPVFTRGNGAEHEQYFLDMVARNEYVFVGGVQSGINHENFAKWVLENSMGKKVHLLAFIRPNMVNHYKPYSVDSSSWSCTSRFGRIGYYEDGQIKLVPKDEFAKKPPKAFIESCKRMGLTKETILSLQYNESWTSFEATEMSTEVKPTKGLAQFITIMNYIYYTILAQNNIGTKIYLAVGQPLHLKIFAAAYRQLQKNGLI